MTLSQLIEQLEHVRVELGVDLEVYQVVPFGVVPVREVSYIDARILRPDGHGPQQVYLHLGSKELTALKSWLCGND